MSAKAFTYLRVSCDFCGACVPCKYQQATIGEQRKVAEELHNWECKQFDICPNCNGKSKVKK